MQQIAIANEADQQFGLVLNNTRITMRVRYSSTSDRWNYDLSIDDLPILHGRRLVSGVDLLEQFNLGLGSLVLFDVKAGTDPDRRALPDGSVGLFYIPPEMAQEIENEVSVQILQQDECCIPEQIVGGTY